MRRTRPSTLLALGLVGASALALIGLVGTSALVYYVTPTELEAMQGRPVVRLYGVVVPGSVDYDARRSRLAFDISDGTTSMSVTSRSLPTSLFGDGIGVVLVGQLAGNGRFEAHEVLVKHSEVYQPLRPGETMPPGLLERLGEG